jgi:hypothetical protein
MPTVNELGGLVANATGLSASTSSSEYTLILSALNRAVRRVIADTGCLKATPGSISGDASTVDVSLATLTNLQSMDSVHVLSSGVYSPLYQAPVSEVINARTASRASMYAYEGSSLLLDGPVGVGNSLYVRYTPTHTALATGGAESTVTATGVPVLFQEDLLVELAVTFILEGFESDEQRAAYHRNLANEALSRFKKFLVDRGGDELPNSRHGAPHFHTPSPLEIR